MGSGQVLSGTRQWFTNWTVRFKNLEGKILHQDDFDPTGKTVFIKMDSYALGDNLAWIPYVEEFRKKFNCTVICSTFFNHLFENVYKDILFVIPNIQISNVYAQYYLGSCFGLDTSYAPSSHEEKPLQKVASDILGLEYREIRPSVDMSHVRSVKAKKVCISERASSRNKEWNGDWQKIVDYLVSIGYEVHVISLEPTHLKNIVDKTGKIPFHSRIQDLCNSDFFIGVSTGLSWLSWACGTHTFLISDYTPPYHEFSSNCTRIYSEKCVRTVKNSLNMESSISEQSVIDRIDEYLKISDQDI